MLRPTTPNRDSQAPSPATLLVPSGTAHSTGSSLTAQSMVRDTTLATLLSDQNTLVHILVPGVHRLLKVTIDGRQYFNRGPIAPLATPEAEDSVGRTAAD